MTNDEIPMTKECLMTNVVALPSSFEFPSFPRHLSLVIRHFPL